MAGYLGAIPVPQATQHRESFTATSGQTTFNTAGYTVGFLDVYLNGSHLSPADFTATNGSDVVLASGASTGDVCDIISYTAFEVNAQTFTGGLDVTGGITADGLTVDGDLAVSAANSRIRLFETDTTDLNTQLQNQAGDFNISRLDDDAGGSTVQLTIDHATGNVGIGVTPSTTLHVQNDGGASNSWTNAGSTAMFTETNSDNPASIKFNPTTTANGAQIVWGGAAGDGPFVFRNYNAERMRIDSLGNVGIGTTSPDNVGSTTALTINRASGNGQLSLMGNGTVYGRIFADNATGDLKMGNPTSNDVMFYTANLERMRIDATGAVTMPAQPAFQAHKNGTDQTNFAANATEVTVTWSHESFDQNADFDLSNNRFVAPVTGKYQLNLMLRLENIDSASDWYVARITTSNQEYSHLVDPDYGQDNVYYPVQISVLADMDANDTATIKVSQQSATAQTDIDGSREYTSFSGYLVA